MQIGRLKEAVKSGSAHHPPPIVSPSKARARTPTGRRRGIPDLDQNDEELMRDMMEEEEELTEEVKEKGEEEEEMVVEEEEEEETEQDVFSVPPSVAARRKKRPRSSSSNHNNGRADWESQPLSSVTNATQAPSFVLYNLALDEMRQLSLIGGGGSSGSSGSSSGGDCSGGGASDGGANGRMEEMRQAATLYHANIARILLWHGTKKKIFRLNQKILLAKMFDKISR